MKRKFVCLAAALALGGCAIGVGENMFFVPQPAPAIVTDATAMLMTGEEKITGPVTPEQLAGRSPLIESRLPAVITKELLHFSKDGRQTGVMHVRAANAKPGEPLIVHCYGNASDTIKGGVYFTDKILPWGELIIWDYPGYGHSEGAPGAAAFDDVISGLVPWIDAQATGRPLVFWGHSIGGLVCSRLAKASREVDAILLETTTPGPQRIVKDRAGSIPLVNLQVEGAWSTFNIPDLLAGFPGPILVVGAGMDEVLPVPMARELGESLKDEGLDAAYVEYPGANHTNAAFNPAFARDAATFFARVADIRH